MGKFSLTNIAEELVAKSELGKEAADNFVRAIIEIVEKGLRDDKLVKIKGLGTFKLMEVSERSSVDVNTGERITIKGYKKVSFTPDSAMKEFVNRPFAHFEPTELNDGYPEEDEPVDGIEAVEVESEMAVSSVEVTTEVVAVAETETDIELEANVDPDTNVGIEVEPTVVADQLVEIAEEPVVETVTETVTESEVEPIAETETIQQSALEGITQPSEKPAKRRGCRGWGCLLMLLLIAATVGVYFFTDIVVDTTDESHDELSEIKVNTNLEEELGAEWDDEPQVETKLSVKMEEQVEVTPSETLPEETEKNDLDAPKQEPVSTTTTPKVETLKSIITTKFCEVELTENILSKEVKDITPADTTDYVIEGTLVTHELKKGETIISLAKKYYGDKRLWPYIVKYNWMKDYDNVAIGQMINVPVLKVKQ